MSLSDIVSSAFSNPSGSHDPLGKDDTTLVAIARRSVHGATLSDRLASASISTFVISRIFRLTANSIAFYANRIFEETRDNPLLLVRNFVRDLSTHIQTNAINSSENMSRIQRMFRSQPSPEFPEPMSEAQAAELVSELKIHFLDHFQTRLVCSVMVATSFRNAIQFTMKVLGEIASTTLNKWVHGVISQALEMDLGEINHEFVRNDFTAFLFGVSYEYNSNEIELNRMSATIGHYLAQHLDRDSPVIPVWRTLWNPTSIHGSVALEVTSPARPWSTAMKYIVSHADRSNITNVLVISELTYSMNADFGDTLRSSSPVDRGRLIIDLMRTHAFIHAFRITRDVQENEENPLYGFALYPYTVSDPRIFDSWPSVCARIRKSLRDREIVENLLGQIRGSIASNNITEVVVPAGSCDTLMVEDWTTGELAVGLNGDCRPEVLVRVADYERMLLHGTAENPFDRQEVRVVQVVRIRVAEP